MGRLSLWVLFGLTLLAVSFNDVLVNAEVGPTESECRPYIEKAIHELKTSDSDDNDSDENQHNDGKLKGSHENSDGVDDDDDDDDDNDQNNNSKDNDDNDDDDDDDSGEGSKETEKNVKSKNKETVEVNTEEDDDDDNNDSKAHADNDDDDSKSNEKDSKENDVDSKEGDNDDDDEDNTSDDKDDKDDDNDDDDGKKSGENADDDDSDETDKDKDDDSVENGANSKEDSEPDTREDNDNSKEVASKEDDDDDDDDNDVKSKDDNDDDDDDDNKSDDDNDTGEETDDKKSAETDNDSKNDDDDDDDDNSSEKDNKSDEKDDDKSGEDESDEVKAKKASSEDDDNDTDEDDQTEEVEDAISKKSHSKTESKKPSVEDDDQDDDDSKADSKEDDTKEVDSKEVDSKEDDTKENDSKEDDTKEVDTKEVDSKEVDSKEDDTKENDTKEVDSKEDNTKETDTKEVDSKEVDSKETDSKEVDSKEDDTKEVDSKEDDSKAADDDDDDDDSSEKISPKTHAKTKKDNDGDGIPDHKDDDDDDDGLLDHEDDDDDGDGIPDHEDEDDNSDETHPEDDLLLEEEIPKNLRDRKHISEILHLNDEFEDSENAQERVAEIILRDVKRIYENAIKPLETLYKYRDLSNRHFGDPEIFSKPLVLFMGPWSGGKSSMINYLTDNEFKPDSLRTGAEPSPAYFNLLMWGNETEVLDGTQLAADWTFSGLQKFGEGLEDRLRGLKMPSKLLEKVNIVEIPGILEVRKQVSRLFPFNDACQWFIDRADIIVLVYDPAKLDAGPETEAILDQLKGREYQTRIILNKADTVKPEELLRVQSALIWNISPLMSSAQPPVMYTTSLWSRPYDTNSPIRLLQAQERAFLRDLRTAVDKRIENRIASARRFAVRVRNHAKMVDCYLNTYYNHKTLFGNKKRISDEIIQNPQDYHIYEGLSTLTNISRYDLPDPEVYRDFFRLNPLYEFKKLSDTCTYFRGCPIHKLDVAIAYDLPELVGKYKKMAEQALAGLDSTSSDTPTKNKS